MNAPTRDTDDQDIDQGEIVRALVDKGGLHEFLKIFWSSAMPGEFCDNWHIQAICEYLEAVTIGQIKRLVINVPPGHMKSLSVGVFWPAWLWTLDPSLRFMFGSFDQSLLNAKQSEPMIALINSELYQNAYPEVQLASKKPALREFKNTAGGFRFNTSPTGKGTGRHVDHLVVDDPMKPGDAISQHKASFTKVNNWFGGTLPTRVKKSITVIMQRLHTDDLAGQCIANGYDTLILPARQTKRAMWVPPAWCKSADPRVEIGEPLWPELFPETKLRELELGLKHEASAQLQQDPTPMSGGIIEEQWTRLEWIEVPTKGTFVQSWDFSSKGTKESHSRVSGDLWCVTRDMKMVRELISTLDDRLARIPGSIGDGRIKMLPDRAEMFVLVDHVGGHWNFSRSKAEVLAAQNRPHWKKGRVKLVERKANGQAIIDELKNVLQGFIGIDPVDDKEARLRVHSDKWEVGQVVYPPGAMGDSAREEHIRFPRFTWDDQVDTATQALDRLASKAERYRENLKRIANSGGDW
jgi:hypothetical protein